MTPELITEPEAAKAVYKGNGTWQLLEDATVFGFYDEQRNYHALRCSVIVAEGDFIIIPILQR